ncbi:MAG: hypothetical protein GY938_02460, partial [Ketobacter sp.]|nr:hypothetical protein [Ketobacter sp.]
DLNVERARLTFHQANKAEIESHLLKGTVIDAVTVQLELTKMVAEIRSKMIALPVRIAQVAIAAQSLHEIQDACRREIYVALDELADNADKYTRPNALHMVGDEIAAGADGLAME